MVAQKSVLLYVYFCLYIGGFALLSTKSSVRLQAPSTSTYILPCETKHTFWFLFIDMGIINIIAVILNAAELAKKIEEVY